MSAPAPSASRRSPLGRDLVISTGGTLAARALAAVGGLLAARLLGPTLRGDYAMVAFVAALAGTIATLGVEYWVTATVARGGDLSTVGAVIQRHRRHAWGVLVAGGIAASAGLSAWHPRLDASVGLVATGIAVANVAAMLSLAVLGGHRRMARVSVSLFSANAVYACGVLALFVVDRRSVAAVTFAAAIAGIVLAVMARTPLPRGPRNRTDLLAARRFGGPAILGEVSMLMAGRVDLFIIGAFLGVDDVGRYAVAVALAELLLVVPQGVSQVLFPQVASHEESTASGPIVAMTLGVGLVGAGVLTGFGLWAIPYLFGAAYTDARSVLPWLSLAAVVLGTWKVLLSDLAGRGQTAIRVRSAGLAIVVMIGADLVLVPRMGIAGAGIGSLAGYTAGAIDSARRWSSVSGHPARTLVALRPAAALLVSRGRGLWR